MIKETLATPLITSKLEGRSRDKEALRTLIDLLATNPDRAIPSILKYFSSRAAIGDGTPQYDATPESSLYQFFKDNNIVRLKKALATEDRPIKPKASDLLELVEVLEQALRLNQLSKVINTPLNQASFLIKEKAKIEKLAKDGKLKVSSLHQRHSVLEMMRDAYSILNGTNKYNGRFSNFLYLKGPAGAGKTTQVMK